MSGCPQISRNTPLKINSARFVAMLSNAASQSCVYLKIPAVVRLVNQHPIQRESAGLPQGVTNYPPDPTGQKGGMSFPKKGKSFPKMGGDGSSDFSLDDHAFAMKIASALTSELKDRNSRAQLVAGGAGGDWGRCQQCVA